MKRVIAVLSCVVPLSVYAQISWTEHTIDGNADYATAVYVADIDKDGDQDVIGNAYLSDAIIWWENKNGVGTSWTRHDVDTNFVHAISVMAADIDGDSAMDIIGTAAYTDNDVAWFENADGNGTTWIKHTIDDNFANAFSVYTGDINGDGYLDALGSASQDDDVTWWENTDGTGTNWIVHLVDGAFDGAISVAAADIDGDDDLDVVGAAYNADDIAWWENADDTGTNWIKHPVALTFDYARCVATADIDGDDDLDIVGAAYNADDIAWFENADDTGTNWIEHTVAGDFDAAYTVYAADIDGDGDQDILGAAYNADDITWWENADDTGMTWIEHTIDGSFDGARGVYAADVDKDQDLDVLGAACEADDITWWESDLVVNDAGVISINVDTLIPEGSVLDPRATVKNLGTDTVDFDVNCEIDPGAYTATFPVIALGPDDTLGLTFSPAFTFVSGSYTVTVYCQVDGDHNPANDTLQIIVRTYDPGIEDREPVKLGVFIFNAATISRRMIEIEFALPEPAVVDLSIYDAIGRRRRNLVAGPLDAGTHNLKTDLYLPAGVYFYTLKVEAGTQFVRKFLIID